MTKGVPMYMVPYHPARSVPIPVTTGPRCSRSRYTYHGGGSNDGDMARVFKRLVVAVVVLEDTEGETET